MIIHIYIYIVIESFALSRVAAKKYTCTSICTRNTYTQPLPMFESVV